MPTLHLGNIVFTWLSDTARSTSKAPSRPRWILMFDIQVIRAPLERSRHLILFRTLAAFALVKSHTVMQQKCNVFVLPSEPLHNSLGRLLWKDAAISASNTHFCSRFSYFVTYCCSRFYISSFSILIIIIHTFLRFVFFIAQWMAAVNGWYVFIKNKFLDVCAY